jgi:hypothetical protein
MNFTLDDDVREELYRLVPPRKRSRVVNEALRKELLQMKREQAIDRLMELRKKTAKFSARETLEALRKDRARTI